MFGQTPLHRAAYIGNTEITSLLINYGAKVNLQSNEGRTPLHETAVLGKTKIAELLITNGANFFIKDYRGQIPYDLAREDEIKEFFKAVQDQINAGLPAELFQLGKLSAGVFTDLLKEESYELYELRSMLQGEQGTGKSTIARFLVGKGPTKFRRSTDGIDLYTGLSFFNDDTEEWISGKQGFKMEDITLSRSVQSFQNQRPPIKQPIQTHMTVSKDNASTLPNKIFKDIFEEQAPVPLSKDETNKDVLIKQGLAHQSHTEENVATATLQQQGLNIDLPRPKQEVTLKCHYIDEEFGSNIDIPQSKQDVTLKLHSIDEDFGSNSDIYQPKQEVTLMAHCSDEDFGSNTDIFQPKQEVALMHHSIHDEFRSCIDISQTKQDLTLMHQAIIEEFGSNIDIPQPKQEATMKQHGLENKSVELALNANKIDDKGVQIISNIGIIGKLKAFFGVKKKVKEVKVSVTKTTFFKKSRDVAKKKFHKQKLVPVTIWDFGGQDVFYSTHQTFLTYRAVYILVLDGSRTLNEPCKYEQFLPGKTGVKTQKDYVHFWINTIITYCKGSIPGFPKIMVILTHKDKLDVTEIDARRTEIFSAIESMFDGSPIEHHLAIKDRIFVNARNNADPEMKKIKKSLIYQARIQPTWGQKLPKCFLPLELEMQYLVKNGMRLIHIDHMKKINSQHPIRQLSDSELKVFLKFQHSVGKILYFDEPFLDQHIITSPTYLIDAFKSIITDHQFCKGDEKKEAAWHSMSKKGTISKQAVHTIWKQKKYAHFLKSKGYLLGVMTRLDILVEPLRYDLNRKRKLTTFYYVASMIQKQDTTGYLQSPTFSQRNIAICFDTSSSIIPPALSFRFISYCLSIWDVKTYGDDNEDMLFHRSAIFTIDPSLDLHIHCEDTNLIVRLVHTRNRTLIMKDLASSIRECLFAALHKISQLYIKTSSERTENIRSFDVRVCCSSSNEPCLIRVQDIGDVWICSRHQIEHGKDLVLSWLTKKGEAICESFCPVTDKNFLIQKPNDLHLRRLSLEYDMTEIRELVTVLGLPYKIWDELYTSTMSNETIRFTALHRCFKMVSFTFEDLTIAVEKEDIQTPHTICKVLRDKHINFDREPEKWDLTPTDEDIDKLAPVVGDSSLAMLVELGLTFHDWEQIQYSQQERDLVKLNRKIMEAWITNCEVHHIKPTLRTIGQAFGNIGINIKNIENMLFN